MKKLMMVFLVIILALAVAACGKEQEEGSSKRDKTTVTPTRKVKPADDDKDKSDDDDDDDDNDDDDDDDDDDIDDFDDDDDIDDDKDDSDDDDDDDDFETPEIVIDTQDPALKGSALSVAYGEDNEILISVKTSATLTEDAWLGICTEGEYLTEEAADDEDFTYSYWEAQDFEKEWFDNIYVFPFDQWDFADLEPGSTYTMVLCDTDEDGKVVGSWPITLGKDYKLSIDFKDSMLQGAGEGRKKNFATPAEELASWFAWETDEDKEWFYLYFSGFYLDETEDLDYEFLLCKEGVYEEYEAADDACFDYSGICDRCPYVFELVNDDLEDGKYMLVMAHSSFETFENWIDLQIPVTRKDGNFELDFQHAICEQLGMTGK